MTNTTAPQEKLPRYVVEKDWITQAGLRAVVIAVFHSGTQKKQARCGYVGVSKESAFFGKAYSEQLDFISQEQAQNSQIGEKSPILILAATVGSDDSKTLVRRSLDIIIDCHGGLTYASHEENSNYPVESNLWWFGFDCSHYEDGYITPSPYAFDYTEFPAKSLEFCEMQCEKIAVQLRDLESTVQQRKGK